MVEWRIRIRGKQRTDIDAALLIQAVIALGKQFAREARLRGEQAEATASSPAEASSANTTQGEVSS